MIVIGFASGGRVLCPACVVHDFGTLTLGTFQGQGHVAPVPVACSYAGVAHVDGRNGPLLAIGPNDADAWEPGVPECTRCGRTLAAGRARSAWMRPRWLARELSHHRISRVVAGLFLMPRLMPRPCLPRSPEPNRPAHRRAPDAP